MSQMMDLDVKEKLNLNYFVSEMILSETPDRDGKRVTMTVYLGSNPDPLRDGIEVNIVCQDRNSGQKIKHVIKSILFSYLIVNIGEEEKFSKLTALR